MSGASVRTGTRIPRNLLATIGLQVLGMLSGDHLGVDFPGARQIRSLAERTRTSPGAVLLCVQHRCLSRSRCSRLTGHVIAEPFISLHVHDHSGVVTIIEVCRFIDTRTSTPRSRYYTESPHHLLY